MTATRTKKLPKFQIHKASGQAYVELSGRRFYLGKHDEPKAQQKYHAMVAEWLAAGRQLRVDPEEITVKELLACYWVHAEQYYRNADGSVSTEVANIRLALQPVKELYAMSRAALGVTAAVLGPVGQGGVARGPGWPCGGVVANVARRCANRRRGGRRAVREGGRRNEKEFDNAD